jgi:hypothetical protein
MKNITLKFLTLSFIIFLFSCGKAGDDCEEPIDAMRSSEIVVIFKDKATGRYLYSEVNPLYNKDSLKVFDQNGNSLVILSQLDLIPNTSSRFYTLSFGNIYNPQTDATALGSEICKNYIVKYNAVETDTIKTCFRITKTNCGSIFNPIKVYHKGQLLDSAIDAASAHITLLKN